MITAAAAMRALRRRVMTAEASCAAGDPGRSSPQNRPPAPPPPKPPPPKPPPMPPPPKPPPPKPPPIPPPKPPPRPPPRSMPWISAPAGPARVAATAPAAVPASRVLRPVGVTLRQAQGLAGQRQCTVGGREGGGPGRGLRAREGVLGGGEPGPGGLSDHVRAAADE